MDDPLWTSWGHRCDGLTAIMLLIVLPHDDDDDDDDDGDDGGDADDGGQRYSSKPKWDPRKSALPKMQYGPQRDVDPQNRPHCRAFMIHVGLPVCQSRPSAKGFGSCNGQGSSSQGRVRASRAGLRASGLALQNLHLGPKQVFKGPELGFAPGLYTPISNPAKRPHGSYPNSKSGFKPSHQKLPPTGEKNFRNGLTRQHLGAQSQQFCSRKSIGVALQFTCLEVRLQHTSGAHLIRRFCDLQNLASNSPAQ